MLAAPHPYPYLPPEITLRGPSIGIFLWIRIYVVCSFYFVHFHVYLFQQIAQDYRILMLNQTEIPLSLGNM